MKRLITIALLFCLLLTLAACNKAAINRSPGENSLADNAPAEIPKISMVVNNSEEDTATHIRTFPPLKERDYRTAYAHYYIESNKSTEIIRIKFETQWGYAREELDEFEVESDSIIEAPTNQWLTYSFRINASNLYFHRITIYYGESEEVLVTRTVYTPYDIHHYSDEEFSDTPPVFHSYSGLTEEEQAFFEKCKTPVINYGIAHNYEFVWDVRGWQTETHLYLQAEYWGSDDQHMVWFSLPNDDLQNYTTIEDYDAFTAECPYPYPPDILTDYYYVEDALNSEYYTISE